MNKFWIVCKYEFKRLVLNKTFIITTLIMPVFLFAVSVLPALIAVNTNIKNVKIGVLGAGEEFYHSIAAPLTQSGIELSFGNDAESMNRQVLKGNIYGYLIIPRDITGADKMQLVTKSGMDYKIIGTLGNIIGNYITTRRMTEEGLNPDKIRNLMKTPMIEPIKISDNGETRKDDYLISLFSGLAVAMLLYMTIMIYGQYVGISVVQEKSSKTVEILLSSIRARDLLFGKILGQGAGGLLQYLIWLSIVLILVKIFNQQTAAISAVLLKSPILIYMVVYYILGYFLYSSLFAAAGAIAEDEQNFRSLILPILPFLILPLIFINLFISQPNSPLAVFMSLFPLTSPIVMCLRMSLTSVPIWEALISIGLLFSFIILVVNLSGKIFRTGILMTGKRFSLKEVMRWIKI